MRIKAIISTMLLGALLSCGNAQTGERKALPEELAAISGNYSMKITEESGQVHYSTAVVKEVAAGQFQIARVTVYGPVLYGFNLGQEAAIQSEELGEGSVFYRPEIKKLTIRFTKGGQVCELSR